MPANEPKARGAPRTAGSRRRGVVRKPRSGHQTRPGKGLRRRSLIETSPLGIVMADRAGRIVRTNVRLEQMFGYERRELDGQALETLLPERLRAAHTRHRDSFFTEPR